jgi:hypothetical protein
MAGRKKIVRLKEGSACEECPLRENTLYYFCSENFFRRATFIPGQ